MVSVASCPVMGCHISASTIRCRREGDIAVDTAGTEEEGGEVEEWEEEQEVRVADAGQGQWVTGSEWRPRPPVAE